MTNELWGEEEVMDPPESLTTLMEKASELDKVIAKKDADLKFLKEEYETLKKGILSLMEILRFDKVEGAGFLFYKETRQSIKVPKSLEDKKALFQYLENKGIFLETVSVNSQTLNALFKDQTEAAAKMGILDFKLPGVEEPTIYTNLKMKRKV